MSTPIALQFYSVREELKQDFEGVVEKIANMGYVGVEYWVAPGKTPAEAAALFNRLGLKVPSAHVPLPVGDNKNEILDVMGAIGSNHQATDYFEQQFIGSEILCDS